MKMLIRKLSISTILGSIIFITSYTNVFADDIEIYSRTQTVPNVLFVIDASGSMNDPVDPSNPGSPTRLQTVKDAFANILSQPYSLLNVGLMDFNNWTGSGVDFPVSDVNASSAFITGVSGETYAQLLTRGVNAYTSQGSTPTVEALYEAALYFRGEEPFEGDQNVPHNAWNNTTAKYTGGHWTSAGLHTYENGSVNSINGWWCLNEPSSFSGANYGLCGSKLINSSTCENYNDQRCSTGTYTCNGTLTGEGCIGNWVCTGALINETHSRCRLSETRNVGSNYITPIVPPCTSNHIVLLSDGKPTRLNNNTKTAIKTLTTKSSCIDLSANGSGISDTEILANGTCGIDLVDYLFTADQSTASVGKNQAGLQNIQTHAIGFQLDTGSDGAKYLDEIAKAGGTNNFIDAGNPAALVSALQGIVTGITQKSRTIARVANTIDVNTLASSRTEVYVPLFTAQANNPRWPGNFKGYTFDPIAGYLVDNSTTPKPVFTPAGDFDPNTRSFWLPAGDTDDGGNVTKGGVARHLDPTDTSTRTTYTDDGPGTSRSLQSLDAANTSLTGNPGLFGLPGATTAQIAELINWARGVDVDDEDNDSTTTARNFVGDALHTDPIIANYSGNQRVAYFMTNEGYLHAIDVTANDQSGGRELFAYMPSDLLDNLDSLRQNVGGQAKVYGLDGPLTLYQVGGLKNVAGNKYMFFGMRRGGMHYYAMDVSNPTSPSLMWAIEGGSGSFQEMGQSWSEPIVTNVIHNGTTKLALVFGGGYDTLQDATLINTADSRGRAVYVVDALTGAKLWSTGPNSDTLNPTPDTHDLDLALANSIAGDVTVVDFNNDTIADRLYFGDTGGSIWRVDFAGDLNGTSGTDYSGYELADLHGTVAGDNRKFFSRPVVAFTASGKLAIAVGSGNRSHPLDKTVQDRFYVIYDPNSNGIPSTTPSAITDNDLQNLTGVTGGFSNNTNAGWRIDLDVSGEKVFNDAKISNGEIFMSTYFPPPVACSNTPDGSRLFVVDLDGKATRDLDGDGIVDLNKSTRNFGIASEITTLYGLGTLGGSNFGISLPETHQISNTSTLRDIFWTNKP